MEGIFSGWDRFALRKPTVFDQGNRSDFVLESLPSCLRKIELGIRLRLRERE